MSLSDQFMQDAGISTPKSYPTYGTPGKLLDNLMMVESSGNPKAINKESGALGAYQFLPSTVAMLKKQGVSFDPMDGDQSRAAADYYISTLAKQNGGDYKKAMAQYGGFVTQDPSGYVGKVMKGVDTNQQDNPAPAQSINSSLSQQFAKDIQESSAPSKLSDQFSKDASAPVAAQESSSTTQSAIDVAKSFNPMNQARALGDFVLNSATGAAGAAVGGVRGLYDLATGKGVDTAVKNIHSTQESLTYTPRSQGGQQLVGAVGDVVGAIKGGTEKAGGTLGQLVGGEQGRLIGESLGNVAPDVAMTLFGAKSSLSGGKVLGDKVSIKGPSLEDIRSAVNGPSEVYTPTAPKTKYKLNNDGSVSAPVEGGQAVVAQSIGELQKGQVKSSGFAPIESEIGQRIAQSKDTILKSNPHLSDIQAQRHAEAASLPVSMRITDAQASGSPVAISHEINSKGKYPQTAEVLNSQNTGLLDNLNALREKNAPYVSGNMSDIGQGIVDSYKKMDTAASENVRAQYTAVTAANAGKFPLDVNQFLTNAKQVLEHKNVAEFVPPEVQSLLGRLEQNPAMTFDNFVNIDKILSQQERAALNSPKGQTGSFAVGLIRSELNKVPAMSDTALPAYQLLAKARATAKARFDAIKADPAYKAVIDDIAPDGELSPLADKFVHNYIANGKTANVNNMMRNLGRDPIAQQGIKAGFVDHIRQASGIDLRTNQGNVTQAGLNKAIQNAGNKSQLILGEDAHVLNTIGNVARDTQQLPRGHFVSTANTVPALMAEVAKNGIETALNVKTLGGYGAVKGIVQSITRSNKNPSSVMLKDLERVKK